jgi:uncharacterized membrane protein
VGRAPDASLGAHAKRRSLHNNYMTLPMLFVMVSGHYPGTYGHALNWLVLAGLALAGAGVRHYFNLRHREKRADAWWIAAAAACMIAVYFVAAPPPVAVPTEGADGAPVSYAAVRAVIALRCAPCHSARPTNEDFAEPAGDAAFDTPEQIRRFAERIFARAVVSRTMPLGNDTAMTREERDLLGRWVAQGAHVEWAPDGRKN